MEEIVLEALSPVANLGGQTDYYSVRVAITETCVPGSWSLRGYVVLELLEEGSDDICMIFGLILKSLAG